MIYIYEKSWLSTAATDNNAEFQTTLVALIHTTQWLQKFFVCFLLHFMLMFLQQFSWCLHRTRWEMLATLTAWLLDLPSCQVVASSRVLLLFLQLAFDNIFHFSRKQSRARGRGMADRGGDAVAIITELSWLAFYRLSYIYVYIEIYVCIYIHIDREGLKQLRSGCGPALPSDF